MTKRADDALDAMRRRAEQAEARVVELEAENASLRFHIAATPRYVPAEEPHPWDVG